MKKYTYQLKALTCTALAIFLFQQRIQAQTAPKLHFCVWGDTRSMDNKVTDLLDKANPEVIIHSGDLWSDIGLSKWKSNVTSKPNLNALLNANKLLVAWGNHESCSELTQFKPSMVKNNSCNYSFTEGNCFFVCLGMNPASGLSFLETQLSSAAAKAAKWRIIYHHYPIYSSGGHSASGNTNYEKLCDKYNVAFVFSGHSHNYDRSKVLHNKAVVFTGNVIPATQKGTTYTVSGGGGAPLYSVSSQSWQEKAISTTHFMELFAYDDSMRVKVYNNAGKLIDNYVRGRYDISTDVADLDKPQSMLHDARPSFFSTSTTIDYTLGKSAPVDIRIYDASGRQVKTLVRGAQPAGMNSVIWNGDDDSGNKIAPGIYICTMISEEYYGTKKLMFVE